jgi:hypothetical protein
MVDAADVLTQLDKAAEELRFVDLGHPYACAVDARLHAYRDDERWALIVESVGYNPRGANLFDVLHVYGNCLTSGEPGCEEGDFHERIDNFAEVTDPHRPEHYRGGAPVVVRGRALTVAAEPGEPLYVTFRRLVPEHRELLLADEEELRARIPADLPEILRLDAWNHPYAPGLDDLPSRSETFRQLATVLATGDVADYRPTLPANTHWSNWPDSGTL